MLTSSLLTHRCSLDPEQSPSTTLTSTSDLPWPSLVIRTEPSSLQPTARTESRSSPFPSLPTYVKQFVSVAEDIQQKLIPHLNLTVERRRSFCRLPFATSITLVGQASRRTSFRRQGSRASSFIKLSPFEELISVFYRSTTSLASSPAEEIELSNRCTATQRALLAPSRSLCVFPQLFFPRFALKLTV